MLKEKYEISVWEDSFTAKHTLSSLEEVERGLLYYYEKDGKKYTVPGEYILANKETFQQQTFYLEEQLYSEKKIGVIGSSSMSAPYRARNIHLTSNINGTKKFSFDMFYKYVDNETGEKKDNPFIKLLVNERKIKLFWKNEWHDFIIKDRQETNNNHAVSFQCVDLFVNELNMNGFGLTFNDELENNEGTINDFATKILEGTDWHFDASRTDLMQEKKEEPVYEIITSAEFTTNEKKVIPKGSKILLYYSCFLNKTEFCQFLYQDNFTQEENDLRVNNGTCYSVNVVWQKQNDIWNVKGIVNNTPTIIFSIRENARVSNNYRADKLVAGQCRVFDKKMNKYVSIYDLYAKPPENSFDPKTEYYIKENTLFTKVENPKEVDFPNYFIRAIEYYCSEESKKEDPSSVFNLLSNASNFNNTNGWEVAYKNKNEMDGQLISFYLSPTLDEYLSNDDHGLADYAATPQLHLFPGKYLNNGLNYNRREDFQKGEKFICKIKARDYSDPKGNYLTNSNLIIPKITKIKKEGNAKIPLAEELFSGAALSFSPNPETNKYEGEYDGEGIQYEFTCNHYIAKDNAFLEDFSFFLEVKEGDIALESVQFFKKAYKNVTAESKEQEKIIYPGMISGTGVFYKVYKYYDKSKDREPDNISYDYVGRDKWTLENLVPRMNTKYEKYRRYTKEKSNRYNLLQEIAQLFECWPKFEVLHDFQTGEILRNSDNTLAKNVYFVNEVGHETGIGFKYGIDLKTIARTVNSDKIATKVIVTHNTNKYAPNGSCDIALSTENYPKTNFILNFDYYITHQLLKAGDINYDLYSTDPGSLQYYPTLNKYNTKYLELEEHIPQLKDELLKQEALLKVYEGQIKGLEEEVSSLQTQIANQAGVRTLEEARAYVKAHTDDEKTTNLFLTLQANNKLQADIIVYANQLKSSIDLLKENIKKLEEEQKVLMEKIDKLHGRFYVKYFRFIQEGSWIDEKYIDHNLYYLDAMNVAYTASRPQVSYNISVTRLSSLEEYKNKVFHVGDISFIEDVDFFGYDPNHLDTPYKEKVLVSEISNFLETPEKDQITIQNYKSQFEDLFQRITSSTQTLQYTSGQYQKAANGFTTNGAINTETLQNSIDINNNLVFSNHNDIIRQDSTGITLTNALEPNKKTKITSGGLFVSVDGGHTWKNAIRGEGVATQYLTAGSINVNNISIFSGDNPTFRWDRDGLTAFSFQYIGQKGEGVNRFNSGVRFDQFGIYGIRNNADQFNPMVPDNDKGPVGIEKIKQNATFGLTWDGFFLNCRKTINDNAVSLNLDSDEGAFVLKAAGNELIRLGVNGSDSYGLFMFDGSGNKVVELNEAGQFWLRDKIRIVGDESGKESSQIEIGNLDSAETLEKNRRIINAKDKFVVYEDGSIKATSGKIGNMTIESIENLGTNVVIKSNHGNILKDKEGMREAELTAYLYKDGKEEDTTNLSYRWFKNGIEIENATNKSIQITYDDVINSGGTSVYGCEITKGGIIYGSAK